MCMVCDCVDCGVQAAVLLTVTLELPSPPHLNGTKICGSLLHKLVIE